MFVEQRLPAWFAGVAEPALEAPSVAAAALEGLPCRRLSYARPPGFPGEHLGFRPPSLPWR